jgi:hypothetical protein
MESIAQFGGGFDSQNSLPGDGGIPTFTPDGRCLSVDERKAIADRKGICFTCGVTTHQKKVFSKKAITDDHAHNGICIKCNQNHKKIPKAVYEAWELRNKPAVVQKPSPKIKRAAAAVRAGNRLANKHRSTHTDASAPLTLGRDLRQNDPERVTASLPVIGVSLLENTEMEAGRSDHSSKSLVGSSKSLLSTSSHVGSDAGGHARRNSRGDLDVFQSTTGSDMYPGRTDMDLSNSSYKSPSSKKVVINRSAFQGRSLGDGSDHSVTRSLVFEDLSRTAFEPNGNGNPSNTNLGTSLNNLYLRDDYTGEQLGDTSAEIAVLLDNNVGEILQIRSQLHTLRNTYDGDRETVLGSLRTLMAQNQNESRIVDVTCGALWRVTADDPAGKRAVVDSGAIDLALEAIAKNRRDVELAEWAMGAVMSVAVEVDHKEYVAQKDAIDSILETLRTHHDKASVFEWSCRCLHILVIAQDEDGELSDNTKDVIRRNIASIEDADGIATIIGATRANEGETAAQLVAVKLLWRLLESATPSATTRIIRKFAKAGIVPLSTRLLRLQSTTIELLEQISGLLCLVLMTLPNETSLIESVVESLPQIIQKMERASGDEKMQQAGLRILATVCIVGNVSSQNIQETSTTRVVIEALRLVMDNPEAVTSGLVVLWKLSTFSTSMLDHPLVVDAFAVMKTIIALESFCLTDYAAIFGFIANATSISDLKLSDIPTEALLSSNVGQRGEAKCLAADSIPFICMKHPEFGNEALSYLMSEDFVGQLGDGKLDKVLPLIQTVIAVGNKANLSFPPGLEPAVISALTKTTDTTVLKNLVDFLIAIVSSAESDVVVAPSTIQTLVGLFKKHQHENDLCQSILNALAQILTASPAGADVKIVAKSILDYVLSPAVTDDTQEEGSIALWCLLAKNDYEDSDMLSRIFSYAVKVFENFVGDAAEAFDASLIERTCGVLASTAFHVRSQPIAIAQADVDTVVSIIYLSMQMENSPSIPCLILEALYSICFVDKGVLIKSGVILVVADTIQKFPGNSVVLEIGFAVLAQLASSEDVHIILSIVFSDGVDFLLEGMTMFPHHLGIQTEACKAFSHLSIEGETRMVVCEQGGVGLIASALASHEDNEHLVGFACSALLNLTADCSAESIEGAGIVARVVRLLDMHPDTGSVRRSCLGILQNVSMKGPSAKEAIATSGGLDAVIRILGLHSDPPDVLERAFTTLWSLAVLPENRKRILEGGGIDHLVCAMLSLVEFGGAQQQACGCLCTLATDPTNRSAIGLAGGCEAIMYGMKVHFSSAEVQSEAARAFSVIYAADNTVDIPRPTQEQVDAVIMAMDRFTQDEVTQARGCAALVSLITSSGNECSSKFDDIRRVVSVASSYFPELCGESTAQVLSII